MLRAVMMSFVMLNVIMLSVVMLRVIMLINIMMNIIMLINIKLSVIMLFMLIGAMQNGIMLSAVKLGAPMLTECGYVECHYAKCRYADCRGAIQMKIFELMFIVGGKIFKLVPAFAQNRRTFQKSSYEILKILLRMWCATFRAIVVFLAGFLELRRGWQNFVRKIFVKSF
jgi:hypothetical protein